MQFKIEGGIGDFNIFSPILKILKINVNIIMRYRLLLLGFFIALFSATNVYSQTGEAFLTGRAVQQVGEDVEGLYEPQVELYKNGNELKARVKADADGYFRLGPLEAGVYTLKIQAAELAEPFELKDLRLASNKTTALGNVFVSGGVEIIEVVGTRNKLNTGVTIGKEQITKIATQNIAGIVGASSGVLNNNGNLYFKGGRNNANAVYVDGQRVPTGYPNVPIQSIEEINVITGGVPAEFGDVLGGVTTITTRGPSKVFQGGGQVVNSKFIDPFGYKLVEGNLTGPLKLKYKGTDSSQSVIGFFIGGSLSHIDVYDPPAIALYRVSDEKLEELKNDPIAQSPLGAGFISRTSFVKQEDMVRTRIRSNTQSLNYGITGSLEFQLGEGVLLKIGGGRDFVNRNDYDLNDFNKSFAMYNWENNPQRIQSTDRAFIRFRQIFQAGDRDAVIQNAYYQIQADYSRFNRVIQDERHKDNFWDYGYLGKFERNRTPDYRVERRRVGDKFVTTNYLIGYSDKGVTFTPGGKNPLTESYTTRFFELSEDEVQSYPDVVLNGGLLNGMSPGLVYSMWANPGTVYNQYSKIQLEQFGVNASTSAEIQFGKGASAVTHQFKLGLQFEQRAQRSWAISGTGGGDIWTLARQLMNFHLTQLDSTNPIPVYDADGNFRDTVNYNFLIDPTAQKTFDKNFRQYLIDKGARDEFGRPITDQTFINIDRYDPSEFKLEYFSPDELISNGVVGYYGYDHVGNPVKGRKSLADFLDPEKRSIGAYNPIYVAGYVQDQFQFRNDVMMRVGVRVDRFDANQPILADPYSTYPIRTVGQVSEINGQQVVHPGNIGPDYKVYVDNALNPTRVLGYRNGDTWYDMNGAELQDPSILVTETQSGTKIQPYLVNEENVDQESKLRLTESSFKDYEVAVNVLPRISFSFPISETSLFYANYDVLTQRPQDGNIGGMDDYYYLSTRSTLFIPNPALKPEKRINYEVGFKQKVGAYTDLTLQAFYGEIRDMVQLTTYNNAYPITYYTFGNIDFGTIKGILFGYEIYRPKSSGLGLTANYTLQFAKGTGSSERAAQGLLNAGQPNLRNPIPLDYDSRHLFSGIIDYRMGAGEDYIGPRGAKNGWEKVFENTGINIVLSARSGTPYTRQVNVTSGGGVMLGIQQRSAIAGEINGSRLPWQFKSDLRIDKDFIIHKKSEAGRRAVGGMTVYLQVNNVFNSLNVVSVYRYTGLPDDDGYLQSAEGQAVVREQPDQQAFTDQYNVKMNNPDNYIQPRFLRVGAMINF